MRGAGDTVRPMVINIAVALINGLASPALTWCAVAVCFARRLLSPRYRWHLPRFTRKPPDAGDSLN